MEIASVRELHRFLVIACRGTDRLEYFLRRHGMEDVAWSLPRGASLEEAVDRTVEFLESRGMIDRALFVAMVTRWPERQAAISRLAALFGHDDIVENSIHWAPGRPPAPRSAVYVIAAVIGLLLGLFVP